MDTYQIIFWLYISFATLTFMPTLKNLLGKVPLNEGGTSFEKNPHFSEKNKDRLIQHYSRLQGTLGFWKKRASVYTSFHYYCVIWTILSSWAVPILSAMTPQANDNLHFYKWLIVLVSGHVALSLSFHKGLKVADGMKAFRHGESQFYDLYRRLLDRPQTLGDSEENQIDKYFSEIERIRRLVRNAETESLPSIEDIQSLNEKS